MRCIAIWLLIAIPGVAENWPGWRGNGTGVTTETGLPTSWSETENISWKANIPGKGLSSPIVWEDRVFLTSAVEGQTRAWVRITAYTLYWLLGLITAWWYLDRIVQNPFFHRTVVARRTSFSMLAILPVTAFCIYAFLMASRWVFWGFPDVSAFLTKPSELHAFFFRGPALLRGAGVSAFFFTCVVLFARRNLKLPGPFPKMAWRGRTRLESLTGWAEAFGVTFLFFLFFLYLVSYILVPMKAQYSTQMLAQITGISCLGLGLAFSGLDKGSRWCWLGPLVALGFISLAIWIMPGEMLGTHNRRLRTNIVYGSLMTLACCWFAYRALRAQERNWHLSIGPMAVVMLTFVFFTANNLLLPETTLSRIVLCLDARTGETLWQREVFSDRLSGLHPDNSAATPTPITDGIHVYTYFGDKGVFCLDFNGNLVWKNTDPVPPTHWGSASSPLLFGDRLILTHNTDHLNFDVAFDKRTGRILWRQTRREGDRPTLDSYGSPINYSMADSPQFLHLSSWRLGGYDVETGEELWFWKTPCWQVIATVTYREDILVAACGAETAVSVEVLKLEENNKPALLWKREEDPPGTSSPVIFDDNLFYVTDNGVVCCLDLVTGKLHWRLELPIDQYWASLVVGDGKLYITGRDGITTVVRASKELDMPATNELDEQISASPAIAGGKLYLRTSGNLYCIGG